jgi:hypothetical protein
MGYDAAGTNAFHAASDVLWGGREDAHADPQYTLMRSYFSPNNSDRCVCMAILRAFSRKCIRSA